MRIVPFFVFVLLPCMGGCATQWVYLTENETTKYFLDTKSAWPFTETTWEVRERFLDKTTDRWYMETEVRYDCQERTFMTLRTREFVEYRPVRYASEIQGNVPVRVVPGSKEEERLDTICSIVNREAGG
jgi:ligand-binding SRPBCC domain-containing protein